MKTAWQGETSLIKFSTLSGYQIVDNDQLAQKWGISQRILKTNSATVTFPANEGGVADYYVLVKPTVQSIDLHLAYVDDDDNEKPITDPAVDEKISGTVGSTVAVTLPKALENMDTCSIKPSLRLLTMATAPQRLRLIPFLVTSEKLLVSLLKSQNTTR